MLAVFLLIRGKKLCYMTLSPTEERKKAFIVFASTFSGAMKHLNREERGELFELLGKFSLENENVHSDNSKVDMLLEMTKPCIISAEKRHQIAVENGSKGKPFGKLGGRPRKNGTDSPNKELNNPQETPNIPLDNNMNNDRDIYKEINRDNNVDNNKETDINRDKDGDRDRDKNKDRDRDNNTNDTITQFITILTQLLKNSNLNLGVNSNSSAYKEQNEKDDGVHPTPTGLVKQIRNEFKEREELDNTKSLDGINCTIDDIDLDDMYEIPTYCDSGSDETERNIIDISNITNNKPTRDDKNLEELKRKVRQGSPKFKNEMDAGDYYSALLVKYIQNLAQKEKEGHTDDNLFYQAADLYDLVYGSYDKKDACLKVRQVINDYLNNI